MVGEFLARNAVRPSGVSAKAVSSLEVDIAPSPTSRGSTAALMHSFVKKSASTKATAANRNFIS